MSVTSYHCRHNTLVVMSTKLLHPCSIRAIHDKLNSPVIKIGKLEVPIDINELVL